MRLLTRSDFDGLACAVLLAEKGIVDEYKFVHPNDIQSGHETVVENDVLANIPYMPGCGLWFDHHASEDERLVIDKINFEGECRPAPSTAQIIWDYYGGKNTFGAHLFPLLEAVNKSDSGNLIRDEILNPEGWILLSFIMDPRTGLGRYHDYRVSNYQLMEDMIEYCRTKPVDEILQLPDVRERTKRYFEHKELFKDMLKRSCSIDKNVVITNLLNEKTIYVGNRFFIFVLFPDQNVEVRLMLGKDDKDIIISCGHSILNRTCKLNIGNLMLKYGGGGHSRVGTCKVSIENWETTLQEIVKSLKKDT